MTRPLAWMKAVRDHPERPPAMQRLVLDELALRMDWQTGCGFASMGQLAADADCDQRTVKRATSWARGTEMLVQTRRGHRINAERTVASEWRLCLPTQQDTGVPLASDPRGQRTRPKGTADPTQGDSTTRPSRTRSSRSSSSARGDGANAPRPPREHQTRYSAPPCPECGKSFSQEQLADPEFRVLALAGAVVCSAECEYADSHCSQCGQLRNDGDTDPLCPRCRSQANGTASIVALPAGVTS